MVERKPPPLKRIEAVFDEFLSRGTRVAVPVSELTNAVRKRFGTNHRLAYLWVYDLATSDDPPYVIVHTSNGAPSFKITRAEGWAELRKDYLYQRAFKVNYDADAIPHSLPLSHSGQVVTSSGVAAHAPDNERFAIRQSALDDLIARGTDRAAEKMQKFADKRTADRERVVATYGDDVTAILGLLSEAGVQDDLSEITMRPHEIRGEDLSSVEIRLIGKDIRRVGQKLLEHGFKPADWPQETQA